MPAECPYPAWLCEQRKFIKVRAGDKQPLERWSRPENRYQWDADELDVHRRMGGNVSLVCDEELVVVDIDVLDANAVPTWLYELPPTFTVRTGGGGLHRYYRVLEDDGYGETHAFDWGEIRSGEAAVACPGNTHPSGGTYEAVNAEESIAVVSTATLDEHIESSDRPDLDELPEPDPDAPFPAPQAIAERHEWMQEYPPVGERSEFDYAVCCVMLRYGVPREHVARFLSQFENSKVAERGTVNYGNTWESARREVGERVGAWSLDESE